MLPIFPFSAIVGQELMKRALLLNAVNPRIGGVLIRGERGTAKSTAARALAALLPELRVVTDCRFGCDPDQANEWCTECHENAEDSGDLKITSRRTSFINLPVSATEDRVVGTLDIEAAIKKGERHFEAGVLAAANRGVLYIDEVNLLDDHVVDLLLDSAAMGVNVVEREGISFTHPARFILVGTMNPEEGDLRPQLLDRFALAVDIHGLRTARERVTIMERNLAFELHLDAYREKWLVHEQTISQEIVRARELLGDVKYTRNDLETIAVLTTSMNVDGHRADLVILRAARAHAAFEGRASITDRDVLLAAELALPHRVKKGPFEAVALELDELQERIEHARAQSSGEDDGLSQPSEGESEKKNTNLTEHAPSPENDPGQLEAATHQPVIAGDPRWWEGGHKTSIGSEFETRVLDTPLDKLTRKHSGKRSRTRTERKRGRYVQARPAHGKLNDLAFDATLRAAAPMQIHRSVQRRNVAFAILQDDLHRKLRVRKAANLILFVVDASWSMAVAERMNATKGAIMSLLSDAYKRRDRVGLIVFQKKDATLVLSPTSSVQLAKRALVDIPVGGKTPLSSGLTLALKVIVKEKRLHPDVAPLMIVLTDGAGNVSMTQMSPKQEAERAAWRFQAEEIRSVVVNMEHVAFDQGLAADLAHQLGAPCLTLQELKAETLYATVRQELEGL